MGDYHGNMNKSSTQNGSKSGTASYHHVRINGSVKGTRTVTGSQRAKNVSYDEGTCVIALRNRAVNDSRRGKHGKLPACAYQSGTASYHHVRIKGSVKRTRTVTASQRVIALRNRAVDDSRRGKHGKLSACAYQSGTAIYYLVGIS